MLIPLCWGALLICFYAKTRIWHGRRGSDGLLAMRTLVFYNLGTLLVVELRYHARTALSKNRSLLSMATRT